MTEADFVESAELLTNILGRWPSFHDAEVLSMHLERAGDDGPTLDARIHVFLITNEVDERGYFVRTHDTLVTLRFTNISLREMHAFNSQNSLFALKIDTVDPTESEGRRFGVAFHANWGVAAELLCDRIIVCSVEPCAPTA